MTKQLIWKLGACSCAILLSACGGQAAYKNLPMINSSSVSSVSSGTTTTTANTGTTTTTANTGTTTTTANTGDFRGVVAQRSRNTQTQTNSEVVNFNISGSNANTVSVDGHTINLNATSQGQRFNTALSYTNFGLANIQSSNYPELLHSYYLTYGQPTPDTSMPTTGSATYRGTAINGLNTPEVPATFVVNYGTKQIDGNINNQISLNGTILGNRFSGSKDGIRMNGRFFGPNAEELGGTYSSIRNPDGVVGSFGARKE